MYKQITTLMLASLLYSSSQQAMNIKPLALGLGALASLATLAYAYTKAPQPAITIIPEHTPGQHGKPEHYFLFTLYQRSTNTRIGSITATYTPSEQTAILQFLQIHHDYQKHGYGLQLWNRMINALKEQNIKTVTWKAIPADMLPSSVGTTTYQQKLDTLVAWYTKRGGIVTEKNNDEVYMKYTM